MQHTIDIDSSEIYSEIEQDISDLIVSHIEDQQVHNAVDSDGVRELIQESQQDFIEHHELDDYVTSTVLDLEILDVNERIKRLERLIGSLVVGIEAFGEFAKDAHAIVNPAPKA